MPLGWVTYEDLMWVIEQNGTDALPILVKGLEHWWYTGRCHAAAALRKLEAAALPAVPVILSAWRYEHFTMPEPYDLWDEDDPAHIVAGIGPRALPWLERALEDDLAIVRARACRNIGAMGVQARHLLSLILELLEDPEEIVKVEAARAILRLAPDDAQAVGRARRVLEQFWR